MADQLQQRPGPHAGGKPQSQRPSTSQVLAVVTLVPAGGILLVLSGLALACSIIGLAVSTPLFVIFSPVLVPAAITIALAITGFLLSGAFGITALSSLSWIINHLRVVAAQMGQKTRELGQGIQKQEGQKRG